MDAPFDRLGSFGEGIMRKPASMRRLFVLTLMLAVGAVLFSTRGAFTDSLIKVTSPGALGADDSVTWTQIGADSTQLSSSFNATSTGGIAVAGTLAGSGSQISMVCPTSPCSWSSTDVAGFSAGDCLIWTSDTANGGNGPLKLAFNQSVMGAGALIQADGPGQFTAQVQAFNGTTSLGTFTTTSDTNGDAVFLGVVDNTAANITSVVYSLTACTGPCTDFAIDTLSLNTSGGVSGPTPTATATGPTPVATTSIVPAPATINFGNVDASGASKAHKVSFVNKGTVNAVLGSVSVPAGFATVSGTDLCSGQTVLPKKSCTMMLQFTPSAPGAVAESVSAPYNGAPATVSVSGNGTTVMLKMPKSMNFPPVLPGMTGKPKSVTITNLSKTASVVLSSMVVNGQFTTASDLCSNATLGPKTHCVISLEFAPISGATTGATGGSMDFGYTFGSNSGAPQAVTLSGNVK